MSPTDVVNQFIAAIEAQDIDAAVALASPDISPFDMSTYARQLAELTAR